MSWLVGTFPRRRKMAKKWAEEIPKKCDLCVNPIKEEFYDAKTKQGRWGILCTKCFKSFGIALGTGFGQHYIREGKNFVKKAG